VTAPQYSARQRYSQPPRGATCFGRVPPRHSTPRGIIREPWGLTPARWVSRTAPIPLPRANAHPAQTPIPAPTLMKTPATRAEGATALQGRLASRRRSGLEWLPTGSQTGDQVHHRHRRETYHHHVSGRRRGRLLRARGALCLVVLAACGVALFRSRARDRGREAEGHHDLGRRVAPLFVGARYAMCVVMLIVCTAAVIRSQLVVAPPMVPVCGLCALAVAYGPKGPPPRSPEWA
jgi:hypothetical protein